MEPISMATVVALLLKYGPEVAQWIVTKWNARGEVTLAEWNELFALAQRSSASQFSDAVTRGGAVIDPIHAANVAALLPKS